MVKPIPYKMNRKGGGTNNETTQIAADNAKPIEYVSVKGRARGIRRPIWIYSITRRDLIAAYESKPAEVSPSPCVTFTVMAAAPIICSKVNILWARSSVPNLVAKKVIV
jgi:hypothetical protein